VRNLVALLLFRHHPVWRRSLRRNMKMKMDTLRFSGTPEDTCSTRRCTTALAAFPKVDVKLMGPIIKWPGMRTTTHCGTNIDSNR